MKVKRIKQETKEFIECIQKMYVQNGLHEEGKHSNKKEISESNDISKSNKRICIYWNCNSGTVRPD